MIFAAMVTSPVVGFVWIYATAGDKCTPAQQQDATELYNLAATPVIATALDSGPEKCEFGETNPMDQSARFNGPVTDTALLAAYRQHASELGWRERATDGLVFLSFDAALADGTPVKIVVSTYEKVVGGVISSFTVSADLLDHPRPTPGSGGDS